MSSREYETLVKCLKEKGVKLVATDFDLTLISIHTHGDWMFTASALATKLRPGFADFLCEVMNQGLFLAVVTFSPQVELVRALLNTVIGEERTKWVCIRGDTPDWKPVLFKRKAGKLSHIDSAIKFFYEATKRKIKLHEVLLLDDDARNIALARDNKINTVQIFDNNSLPEFNKKYKK